MWEIILDFFKTKTNEKKRKVSNKAVITVNISQNHYWFFNCCCFGICGFYTALASWFWFSLSESRTCVSEHFLILSGGGEFTTFSISSSPFLGKCLIFPLFNGRQSLPFLRRCAVEDWILVCLSSPSKFICWCPDPQPLRGN